MSLWLMEVGCGLGGWVLGVLRCPESLNLMSCICAMRSEPSIRSPVQARAADRVKVLFLWYWSTLNTDPTSVHSLVSDFPFPGQWLPIPCVHSLVTHFPFYTTQISTISVLLLCLFDQAVVNEPIALKAQSYSTCNCEYTESDSS